VARSLAVSDAKSLAACGFGSLAGLGRAAFRWLRCATLHTQLEAETSVNGSYAPVAFLIVSTDRRVSQPPHPARSR
jgi:hypothetical protein